MGGVGDQPRKCVRNLVPRAFPIAGWTGKIHRRDFPGDFPSCECPSDNEGFTVPDHAFS